MNKVLRTFQTFMEDALQKSLPEMTLAKAKAPDASIRILKARLRFEGKDMKAQAFLSCSEDFLQETCPLTRGTAKHAEPVIKDWLGELGNLILGRLKNRLLAHDVTIKISAPDFEGEWVRPENAESVSIWFASNSSYIGLECLVEGSVPKIGDAVPQTAEILPGDAIYRLTDNKSQDLVDVLSKIRAGVSSEESETTEQEDRIETPLIIASEKPKAFTMHFHGAKENLMRKSTLSISGITWPQAENLHIRFSNGLELSLNPKLLLDQGQSSLEIEGLHLEFKRDSEAMRLQVPELQLNFARSLKSVG